jgi:hypothetical protein
MPGSIHVESDARRERRCRRTRHVTSHAHIHRQTCAWNSGISTAIPLTHCANNWGAEAPIWESLCYSCESLISSKEHSPWKPDSTSSSKKFSPFVEPKGSLPCSQKPDNDLILSQMNSIHTLHPIILRPIWILSSYPRLDPPSGLFASGFPAKMFTYFSCPPCALHAPPISSFSTWPS